MEQFIKHVLLKPYLIFACLQLFNQSVGADKNLIEQPDFEQEKLKSCTLGPFSKADLKHIRKYYRKTHTPKTFDHLGTHFLIDFSHRDKFNSFYQEMLNTWNIDCQDFLLQKLISKVDLLNEKANEEAKYLIKIEGTHRKGSSPYDHDGKKFTDKSLYKMRQAKILEHPTLIARRELFKEANLERDLSTDYRNTNSSLQNSVQARISFDFIKKEYLMSWFSMGENPNSTGWKVFKDDFKEMWGEYRREFEIWEGKNKGYTVEQYASSGPVFIISLRTHSMDKIFIEELDQYSFWFQHELFAKTDNPVLVFDLRRNLLGNPALIDHTPRNDGTSIRDDLINAFNDLDKIKLRIHLLLNEVTGQLANKFIKPHVSRGKQKSRKFTPQYTSDLYANLNLRFQIHHNNYTTKKREEAGISDSKVSNETDSYSVARRKLGLTLKNLKVNPIHFHHFANIVKGEDLYRYVLKGKNRHDPNLVRGLKYLEKVSFNRVKFKQKLEEIYVKDIIKSKLLFGLESPHVSSPDDYDTVRIVNDATYDELDKTDKTQRENSETNR